MGLERELRRVLLLAEVALVRLRSEMTVDVVVEVLDLQEPLLAELPKAAGRVQD